MRRDGWVVMLAFIAGILLANLLQRDLLTTYGILNDYFLRQYSYQAIDGNRLFCQVLLLRGKTAFIIFLLGRVLRGRGYCMLMESLLGVTFGFLAVVSIVNLGVRGIAVLLCGLFPQWIFYLCALFCHMACVQRREEEAESGRADRLTVCLTRGMLLLLLTALGIVTESYVNPALFGFLVKFL